MLGTLSRFDKLKALSQSMGLSKRLKLRRDRARKARERPTSNIEHPTSKSDFSDL
jgi:hypothetical protein